MVGDGAAAGEGGRESHAKTGGQQRVKDPGDSKPSPEALMVCFFRCSGGLIPCLIPASVIKGGLQGALGGFESHRHSIAGEGRNHAGGIPDRKRRAGLRTETESRDSAEAGGVDVGGIEAVGEFLKAPRSKVSDQ